MKRYLWIPLGGTQIRTSGGIEWRNRGSAFDVLAVEHGFDRVDIDGDPTSPDPGIWSRAINGLMVQMLWRGHRKAWTRGVENLLRVHRLMSAREEARAVHELRYPRPIIWIGHSHGGAVAALALAASQSTKLHPSPAAFLSLDMPVRRWMSDEYRRIREMHPDLPIIHCHSTGYGWHARYRWLGSQGNSCEWDIADCNLRVDGGHSRFLSDDDYLPQWATLWPAIRQTIEDGA